MASEILSLTYHSCSLVLEVNVHWRGRGMKRECILGFLTPKENASYFGSEAEREIFAFVEAVKAQDPRAIAEVKRAIYAQRTARDGRVGYYHPQLDGPECCYDRAERTNV